jgi:hypothetical protein
VRRAAWLLALPVVLSGCQNDDAYLGSRLAGYVCGGRCERDRGVADDVGDWFTNPEAEQGDSPEIVYPLEGSAHPKDLSRLTVQFRHGRADLSAYRIRFEAPDFGLAYDFFAPCLAVASDGCRYLLEGNVWDSARADLTGKPVRLSVSGATSPSGVIKTSAPVDLQIVESSLGNKGFYYWTLLPQYPDNSGPLAGIFRLPFGADRAQPYIMPNTGTNDKQCGACHSVSSDGSTIAFTARDYDGGPDQRSGTLAVKLTARPDKDVVPPAPSGTYDSSMMALTSDGKRVLVSYDEQLVLRSAGADPAGEHQPGDVLATLTRAELGGKAGYFPEFSANDDAVVLTLSDQPDSAIAVRAGDIAVIDFDVATSTFGKPRIIVPGTDDTFHFYPTWAPTGEYVAFASAPRGIGEDGNLRKSYDQKEARLRLVSRDGTRIFDLENATYKASSWSTYPKFAPFSAGQDDALMFLTFNSKVNYGFMLDNEQREDGQRLAQLWMSAIDVTKLPADPSSAPIWLPFQDVSQTAHLGIWTRDVKCRTDLGVSSCDLGQRCEPQTNTCIVDPR